MSDSIYTVLIIAWVVYGIYKAINKNQGQNKAKPQASASTEAPLESLLENLLQGNQSNNQNPYYKADFENRKEEIRPSEVEEEVEEEFSNQEFEQISKLDTYSGSDNASQVTQAVEDKVEGETSQTDTTNLREEKTLENDVNFDLRQAVIAQIILERPYQ